MRYALPTRILQRFETTWAHSVLFCIMYWRCWLKLYAFATSQTDAKHEWYLRSGGPLLEAFFRLKLIQNTKTSCDLVASCWRPFSPHTNPNHDWYLRSGDILLDAFFVSDPFETRKVYAIWWRAVGGLSNLKPMRNANGICDLLASCWKPSSSQTDAKHEWHLRSGDLLSETFVVSNRWETRMESAIW